ncbi:uncharacterized protein LOC112562724 [Pomacea canaliculata]|uniref:uncharacterized protein LOC112562724 n=1 Tax=Pomacea canaliculata TaxID=400727 RepID=UPI000D72666F|nr:uncharacterized protein LOC112562724 [Pomacea canaliculata]
MPINCILFQQMALFHVVEFLEEAQAGLKGPVAVIPDSWLLPYTDPSGNRFCNWPPKSVKADANFIIKAKKPDSLWPLYRIRLHKSLSNYQAASQICERLKDMSEVESDDTNAPTQTKRPRITPIRFRSVFIFST